VLGNVTGSAPVHGLVAGLEFQLVGESLVVEFLLFAQVLEIGNREGEADPVVEVLLGYYTVMEKVDNKWRLKHILFIAEFLGQHNFLITGNILDLRTNTG
jgi:hypothetical protein